MNNIKNVPEIRFKGCYDENGNWIAFTHPWEQRKLSDVVDSVDTGKSKFDKEGSSGEYPILGSTSVIGYDDEYDYEGDFILTARVGANAGSLYRHAGKVKISDNTVFIQASQNIEFLYQLLIRFDIKKLSFGTGQPLVKASELKSLELMMPTDMKEQMRIGVYFKNLDHLITLHQCKCDTYEKLKKCMMQKLLNQVLRFKADDGSDFPEWEEKKLGEVLEISTQTNGDKYNKQDVLSVSDEYGVVNQIELQGRSFAGNDISKYKVVKTGQLVYTRSPLAVKPFGIIKRVGEEIGIVSPLYIVNDVRENNCSMFWYYNFDTPERTNDYLKPLVRMGAKHTMNISNEEWLSGKVMVPCLAEQQKIADYFSSLDNVIENQNVTVAVLKKLKKCMLQKMFV